MRSIRLSKTYDDELENLLLQGLARFSLEIVADKRDRVERTIRDFLAHYPVRPIDPEVGLCTFRVTKTPFVLIYDYDDHELRIHVIVHASADRSNLDLSAVEW